MARTSEVDFSRGGDVHPHSPQTEGRVEAFLERWRRGGGPAIEGIEEVGDGEAIPASTLLPEMPTWLSEADAIVQRDKRGVFLWLHVDFCGERCGSLQFLFRRPGQWRCPSVNVHYYVICSCFGRREDVLLTGVEQCGGDLVILSPPAPGEMLIYVSESY